MDWAQVGVLVTFGFVITALNVLVVATYIFWKNARLRQLQTQMDSVLNFMEDHAYVVNRELSQIWTYILPSKTAEKPKL